VRWCHVGGKLASQAQGHGRAAREVRRENEQRGEEPEHVRWQGLSLIAWAFTYRVRAVFKPAGPAALVVMAPEVCELALVLWVETLAVLGRMSRNMQHRVRTQAQAWHRAACTEALQWCSRSQWHEMQSNSHCVLAVVLVSLVLAGCCQVPSRALEVPEPVLEPVAETLPETHAAPCLAQCMRDAMLERLQASVERALGTVQRAQATLDTAHDALHAARNRMAVDCHEALC